MQKLLKPNKLSLFFFILGLIIILLVSSFRTYSEYKQKKEFESGLISIKYNQLDKAAVIFLHQYKMKGNDIDLLEKMNLVALGFIRRWQQDDERLNRIFKELDQIFEKPVSKQIKTQILISTEQKTYKPTLIDGLSDYENKLFNKILISINESLILNK